MSSMSGTSKPPKKHIFDKHLGEAMCNSCQVSNLAFSKDMAYYMQSQQLKHIASSCRQGSNQIICPCASIACVMTLTSICSVAQTCVPVWSTRSNNSSSLFANCGPVQNVPCQTKHQQMRTMSTNSMRPSKRPVAGPCTRMQPHQAMGFKGMCNNHYMAPCTDHLSPGRTASGSALMGQVNTMV
jgi:hypothetical protein